MFVIKGINNLISGHEEIKGTDLFIKIVDELTHECIHTLSEEVTTFETYEQAETIAQKQIIGAFENFQIIEKK